MMWKMWNSKEMLQKLMYNDVLTLHCCCFFVENFEIVYHSITQVLEIHIHFTNLRSVYV
jgi:hypothetical protein